MNAGIVYEKISERGSPPRPKVVPVGRSFILQTILARS